MGFSGGRSGRWHRADIVRAAWESVLSGASAGITYGAAGIYSWHMAGTMFGSSIGEGFAAPKPWQDALNFEGAWDYGFLAYWIGLYQLYDLVPDPGFLAREYEGVRVAKCARGHVLYVPYNVPLKTTRALKGSGRRSWIWIGVMFRSWRSRMRRIRCRSIRSIGMWSSFLKKRDLFFSFLAWNVQHSGLFLKERKQCFNFFKAFSSGLWFATMGLKVKGKRRRI